MSLGAQPNVRGGLGVGADCAGGAGQGPACGTELLLAQAPPGVSPVPAPGAGSPYSQTVYVRNPGGYSLRDLTLNCPDTGVTLTSSCNGAVFYQDASGTKTYKSAAGWATMCVKPFSYMNWQAGQASADVSVSPVYINVSAV